MLNLVATRVNCKKLLLHLLSVFPMDAAYFHLREHAVA